MSLEKVWFIDMRYGGQVAQDNPQLYSLAKDQVDDLWIKWELGNDNCFWRGTLEQLREHQYNYLAEFLRLKGMPEEELIIVHWWW